MWVEREKSSLLDRPMLRSPLSSKLVTDQVFFCFPGDICQSLVTFLMVRAWMGVLLASSAICCYSVWTAAPRRKHPAPNLHSARLRPPEQAAVCLGHAGWCRVAFHPSWDGRGVWRCREGPNREGPWGHHSWGWPCLCAPSLEISPVCEEIKLSTPYRAAMARKVQSICVILKSQVNFASFHN